MSWGELAGERLALRRGEMVAGAAGRPGGLQLLGEVLKPAFPSLAGDDS